MSFQRHEKSQIVGLLLSFLWPGSVYLYLGRVWLGLFLTLVVWPALAVSLLFLTAGFGTALVWLAFIIDGTLAPTRYNQRQLKRAGSYAENEEVNHPGFPRGSITWETGSNGTSKQVFRRGQRAGSPHGARQRA